MINDGVTYSFGVILEPMRSDLDMVGSIALDGFVLAGVTMLIGPFAAAAFVNRLDIQIMVRFKM